MLCRGVRVPLLSAYCFSVVEIQVEIIFAAFLKAIGLTEKSNVYIFPHEHEDIDEQNLL